MKNLNFVISVTALVCAALFTVPASAYSASDTVTCKDGSSSHDGKGSCAHHGGIDKKATDAAAGASAPAAAPAAPKAEPVPAAASASAETVDCKDGSMSHGGKGACSHHGGIKKSGASESPAVPAATSTESTRKTESSDSTGATAKCKDGTFSHSKHHSGSCSHHGGVDKFL